MYFSVAKLKVKVFLAPFSSLMLKIKLHFYYFLNGFFMKSSLVDRSFLNFIWSCFFLQMFIIKMTISS